MFNRYIGNSGRMYKVEDMQQPRSSFASAQDPYSRHIRPERPPAHTRQSGGLFSLSGLADQLRQSFGQLLPQGMELGDILLIVILFLLYLESKDEELLITLAAFIVLDLNLL